MKFALIVTVTLPLVTEVEADTIEEAIKIARQRPLQQLCSECTSGDLANEWALENNFDECDPTCGEFCDLHVNGRTEEGVANFVDAEELWDAAVERDLEQASG